MPSRRIFEEKTSDPASEDADGTADTIRNPRSQEEEQEPVTLRSHEIKELEPETLRNGKIQAAADARKAVTENLELKDEVERLKAKIAELETENKQIPKLKELAIFDGLTGLHTRRSFDDHMKQTADEAIRYDKDFSLIFVDLDKFKPLNDQLGHLAGDEALRLVAKIIHATFRPSDVKCRYGGEELTIILPDTDKHDALIAAKRLRGAIEAQLKPHLRKKYGKKADNQMCTASIGVTSYHDSEPRTEKDGEKLIETILKEVDGALYEAKDGGRNQVRVHGEEAISGKLHEKAVDTVIEKRSPDEYAEQMKKSAEQAIPEADMRENALREAADQIGRETSV